MDHAQVSTRPASNEEINNFRFGAGFSNWVSRALCSSHIGLIFEGYHLVVNRYSFSHHRSAQKLRRSEVSLHVEGNHIILTRLFNDYTDDTERVEFPREIFEDHLRESREKAVALQRKNILKALLKNPEILAGLQNESLVKSYMDEIDAEAKATAKRKEEYLKTIK